MDTRALVLGGGGPVGIAWEKGLLAGLAAEGVDVEAADHILGTSAGSVVGAELASGRGPAAMLQAELAYAAHAAEAEGRHGPAPDLGPALALMARRPLDRETPVDLRIEFGAMAMAARTVSEDAYLAGFGGLADAHRPWPPRFACTAVDAVTGAFVVWDEDAAAPLGRAVASSCAVPGVFPPVTIDGRKYVDGGVRSGCNADVAHGHGRVLVVAVVPPLLAGLLLPGVRREMEVIAAAGGRAELIVPDAEAAATFGPNLLDGARRGDVARAGERQGRAEAARIKAFWN